MSFAPHTPEALLPRSDSKNPATTCKGITSTGRPCRRSLGSVPKSSPGSSPLTDRGVLAVLRDAQDDGNSAAAFYCWQHKDQAERVAKAEKNHTELFPLQERTSIDTLVDRVGVMNLEEEIGPKETRHKRRKRREGATTARTDLPDDWQRMQGPLMSVPTNMMSPSTPLKQQPKQPPRSNVKASLFCCVRDVDDEEQPPPRHHPRPTGDVPTKQIVEVRPNNILPVAQMRASPQNSSPLSRKPVPSTPNRNSPPSPGPRTPHTPTRPILATTPQSNGSQTQNLLALIPPHLSPLTTSTLLTELSKPISPADASGYIYMFWLTPDSATSKPDSDAASDLLLPEPPSRNRPSGNRRKSDVLHRYASQRRGPTQPKTMLLKIGRAENVHRRLSQWSKQCGHNITLIRYYPYTPSSSSSPSPQSGISHSQTTLPRKVPHVHRVERLIHIELAERRVTEQGACGSCGREHREWFEVEASREGLRGVDEVVRRWVGWGERQG